jgi:hypothetical protein
MSIRNNYPTTIPSLKLDFIDRQRLDPRITYSRATTATYVAANGVLVTAKANTPRFDYDPSGLGCKGLLIESSVTNLINYSEATNGLASINVSAALTANTAPNGLLTAIQLTEDANLTSHYLFQQAGVASIANNYYTLSVFAKANSRQNLVLVSGASGAYNWYTSATYNLTSGTATAGGGVGTNSATTYNIQPYANGWYRCSVTSGASDGNNCNYGIYLANGSGSQNYQGDGSSGLYIWGQQLEYSYTANTFPSSYISTSGSQVTRSADIASISGNNFTNNFNYAQGTIIVGFDASSNGNGFFVYITSGGSANNTNLSWNAGLKTYYFGAGSQSVAAGSIFTSSVPVTIGSTYFSSPSSNLTSAVENAGSVSSNLVNLIFSTNDTTLWLGNYVNGQAGLQLGGHLRFFRYYPIYVSKTTLQTLTSI